MASTRRGSLAMPWCALLLAACATPAEFKSTTPHSRQFDSAKPAQAVTACIQERWTYSTMGTYPVRLGLLAEGFSVTHSDVSGALIWNLVEVLPQPGGGSRTVHYRRVAESWPHFDEPVQQCQ